MKINPDDKAMPDLITDAEYHGNSIYGNTYSYGGLSIRAHFAAMAMTGLIDSEFTEEGHELTKAENVARRAVRCADALIAELNKEKP